VQELERSVRILDFLLDVRDGGEDARFGPAGEVDGCVDGVEDTGKFLSNAGRGAGDDENLWL